MLNNTMSENEQLARVIVYTFILPALLVFGLYGNVIAIIVLCRQKKTTFKFSLICLILSDILLLITSAPGVIMNNILLYAPSFLDRIPMRIYGFERLSDFALQIEMHVVLSIGLERVVATWIPLKAKIWCTTKVKRVVFVCSFVWSTTVNLVLHFIFSDGFMKHKNVNTDPGSKYEEMAYNGKIALIFAILWHICHSLPIALVAVCNMCILYKLLTRYKDSLPNFTTSMKRAKQEERKFTVTILLFTFMFLACYLPMTLLFLYSTFAPEIERNLELVYIAFVPLGTFNTAFNFYVFVARNSSCKQLFFKTIQCK